MQFQFVLGGRSIPLNSLQPALDQRFIELHSAYLGPAPFNWSDLHRDAKAFLATTPDRHNSHNAYFNNFTHVWNGLLASARFDDAEALWQSALEPVLQFEADNPPREIHKGTAYYFWGMTAIIRGDLDKGYALTHQAVEEDVATMQTPFPDTPAYALATLNFAKHDQAFRPWVLAQAQYLNTLQNSYSAQHGRPFTLEDFRAKFLNSPPSTDIAFLLAYSVARLMRLSSVPPYAIQSRFMGQLLLNLFFDITLCIENAASAKNPAHGTFINHAEFIASRVGSPLTNAELGDINQRFKADFNATLLLALDRTLPLSSGNMATALQSDIALAYGIRNRGGHDVSSAPAVWQRYRNIEQALFNVLFMTIDFVY
jgi:hypothetical protein